MPNPLRPLMAGGNLQPIGAIVSPWSESDNQNLLEEIKQIPIKMTIRQCFTMVHSRTGTQVKDQEKSYLADSFDIQTKTGSIIVRKISPTFFTFGIYLGIDVTGPITTYRVLTTNEPIFSHEDKLNKKFIELNLDAGSLLNCYMQPEHSYEPGKQQTTLETYMISLGK
jgi:hypothetical protein